MMAFGNQIVCTACLSEVSRPAVQRANNLRDYMDARRHSKAILAAGIPERFIDADFSNFVAQDARANRLRDVMYAYTQDFDNQRQLRPGFLFIGNPGTGKSHLSCAIAQELICQGRTAVYESLSSLTVRIRHSYDDDATESTDSIIKTLVNVDFLILDEIDLHGASDTDYINLFEIINGRWERKNAPTLACSNRPLDRLNRDLDERITSRILAGFPPMVFDWENYRDTLPAQLKAARPKA